MQKKTKTVGLFTPFPQIIGGGERYLFTLAESFSLRGFNVEILSPFDYDISYIAKNFDLKLQSCTYKKTKPIIFFLPSVKKKYQYFFTLSNHIYPPIFGRGKYNTIIIQFPFPFPHIKFGDKLQRILLVPKLLSYQRVLCYSNYSNKWIKKSIPKYINHLDFQIVNPPVDKNRFSRRAKKRNIILSVGRFFPGDHNKQHIALITLFKRLVDEGKLKQWQFHLAGFLSQDKKNLSYFKNVQKSIGNYPIYLHPNASPSKIAKLYEFAKILWHAVGYKNNEDLTPEKSEHFGISVIEAMRAGAIPLVANAGGLKEIVKDTKNGFLWESFEELKKITILLDEDKSLFNQLSKSAYVSAKKYDIKIFYSNILELYP